MKMKNILRNIWEKYKIFAGYIGDFQARWLLTVFYFTIAVPFALIGKFLMDPLEIRKKPLTSAWLQRREISGDLESARRQY
jgi:hypothetical protein